ncbi:MAG: hypothetical protein H6898_11850 [Rhodobacter sp.]|nr:hypothetical protein [Paracoccaceae bacterium]MCC0077261.1 hypothetical protein [Rhodobacter sp.]
MKLFTASLVAATLLAPLAATTASATACNIVANRIDGNGNFVDLDVSGCGYASTYLHGSYSFAQIINRFGRVVSGIVGNGHYYEVHNLGDNDLGILVDGIWHRTHVDIRGNGTTLDLVQQGAPSRVTVISDGNFNDIRVRTH